MAHLWILVCSFLLADSYGFRFSEHLDKYLNHSIDVCDNFYDHVCSAVPKDNERFKEKATRLLDEKMAPFMSKDFQLFLDQHEANLMNANEYEFLKKLHRFDALYKYVQTKEFQETQNEFKPIFQFWASAVRYGFYHREEFTKHGENNYDMDETLLESTFFVYDSPKFDISEVLSNIVKSLNSCLSINDSITNCYSDALHFVKHLIGEMTNDQQLLFNGFYEVKAHFKWPVILYPSLYTLEKDEYQKKILSFMLGKSLGTFIFTVFYERTQQRGDVSNFEFFKRLMANACEDNCANCTFTDTGSTFTDDAAEWVAVKMMTYVAKAVAGTSPYHDAFLKEVFYLRAMMLCSQQDDAGDAAHSPAKVLVNGINAMFPEFARIFNCKLGDQMVQREENCNPLTGFGVPNYG